MSLKTKVFTREKKRLLIQFFLLWLPQGDKVYIFNLILMNEPCTSRICQFPFYFFLSRARFCLFIHLYLNFSVFLFILHIVFFHFVSVNTCTIIKCVIEISCLVTRFRQFVYMFRNDKINKKQNYCSTFSSFFFNLRLCILLQNDSLAAR